MFALLALLLAPTPSLAKSPGSTSWIRCEGERGSLAEFAIVTRGERAWIADVNLRGVSGRNYQTRKLDVLESQTFAGLLDYGKIGRLASRQIVFQYYGSTMSFCFDEDDKGTCKVIGREDLPDPEVERARRNEPRLSCPPDVARQVGGCER